jgi:AraC family transcriptional regulator, L-rhamnose operon transcriptional activator RhaR
MVFAAGRLPIASNRHVMTGSYEAHSHDFIEIVLITGGSGIHQTAAGAARVQVGDAFLFWPGAWHAYLACDRLVVCNCYFGSELLQRELAWIDADPYLAPLLVAARGAERRLTARLRDHHFVACVDYLAALRQLTESGGLETTADRLAYLLLILSRFAAVVHDRARQSTGRSPSHPAVVRGMGLLARDLARPWTLGELAATLNLERAYVVRLFKAHTGLPPMAYLSRQRAERASALVLETDLPISEIARQVGWDDPNYFARRFRSYLGMSASAYRSRYARTGTRPDPTHKP